MLERQWRLPSLLAVVKKFPEGILPMLLRGLEASVWLLVDEILLFNIFDNFKFQWQVFENFQFIVV